MCISKKVTSRVRIDVNGLVGCRDRVQKLVWTCSEQVSSGWPAPVPDVFT